MESTKTTQAKGTAQAKGRTRGRVPADAERVKTTLLLDLDTVEWGKHQPGGLSEIIRRLLRQEMDNQEMEQKGQTR